MNVMWLNHNIGVLTLKESTVSLLDLVCYSHIGEYPILKKFIQRFLGAIYAEIIEKKNKVLR